MTCPKCGSENVLVTNEQVGGKTKTKKTGCLPKMGRAMMMICTFGLWGIFGKKKERSSTSFKNKTVGICQSCGHRWNV